MGNVIDEAILKVDFDRDENISKCLQALTNSIARNYSDKEFGSRLAGIGGTEKQVSFVGKYFTWIPVRPEVLKKYDKNAETAQIFIDRGNWDFKYRKYDLALESYNMAVMFAPTGHEVLGVALANRAAVLVETCQPEEAIKDIDAALQIALCSQLTLKLHQRRSKCEDMIRQTVADNSERRTELEKEIRLRQAVRQDILDIKSPNRWIPAASDSVGIEWDDVEGRYLIATKDIPAGSTVIVENPYVHALNGEAVWDTKHCHHCLRRIVRGIPCKSCVFVIYCTQSCLLAAWKEYHGLECGTMAYLHCNRLPPHLRQAFRIICKVGPMEIEHIFTHRQKYSRLKRPFGTSHGQKYESDSYRTVFHLMDQLCQLDLPSLTEKIFQAIFLTNVLDCTTSFFNRIDPYRMVRFKNFVSALLLHHIDSLPLNVEVIDEVDGLDNLLLNDLYDHDGSPLSYRIENSKFRQLAWGLYPTYSLAGHSCDPNVHRISDVVNGTLIVVSNREIKAGEAIRTSYNTGFVTVPKAERQADLLEHYNFQCKCIACRYNWPILGEMDLHDFAYCCPTCSRGFSEDEKGSEEFKKCVLKGPKWTCRICCQSYNEVELRIRHAVSIKRSLEAAQNFSQNRPVEAIQELKRSLAYYQYHVRGPYEQQYRDMLLYVKALAFIFHFAL